ncbi:MAG TPA: CBS domain-containing protein [Thermoplasmata archaeon]|nr:CBS domain-containing protein [Thermoplasmata archaeon]
MGGMVEAMELRDIISGSVPTKIKSDATVADALVAMMERKTDYVLVDRSGPNDAYGIVTRWDIIEKAIAKGEDITITAAVSVARKPLVVTNNMDLDLRWVAKKMADEGVSRLAVFDKENFLGFVSDLDVLRAASAKKPSKAEKGAKA